MHFLISIIFDTYNIWYLQFFGKVLLLKLIILYSGIFCIWFPDPCSRSAIFYREENEHDLPGISYFQTHNMCWRQFLASVPHHCTPTIPNCTLHWSSFGWSVVVEQIILGLWRGQSWLWQTLPRGILDQHHHPQKVTTDSSRIVAK